MFIGSSREGLEVARALQFELQNEVDSTIWSQGVFGLSEGTLEALEAQAHDFDFAALVLTPDDLLTTRGESGNAPRDNVVFEAGLFMGALGRKRVFLVACRDDDLDLPTDLAGITLAEYNRREDGNLIAAVGPVATNMRMTIEAVSATSNAAKSDVSEVVLPRDEQRPDFTRLLTAIDEMNQSFQSMPNAQLRTEHARVYGTLLASTKATRPDDPLLAALSAPEETAVGGIFRITVAEARTGLNMMRSALVSADETPATEPSAILEITRATYKGRGHHNDVTDSVRALVRSDGRLMFTVNNDTLGGDPEFGVPKTLEIEYRVPGDPNVRRETFDEHAEVDLP